MHVLRGPAIVLLLLAVVCTFGLLFRLFLAQRRMLILTTTVVAMWFVAVGVLALRGFFADFASLPPHLLFALLLPAVVFGVFNFMSKSLPQALRRMPLYWLIGFQVFRVVVEIILYEGYKAGVVPVQMTFDGRNFDILIGLSAPLAAWLYAKTRSAALGIVWNVAGLASVINIAVVAVLSMPTPLRHFMNNPPNTLLTHFPFIYLPAVLVPAAYIAHVLSVRQILQQRAI
jgi:hypothetical protein